MSRRLLLRRFSFYSYCVDVDLGEMRRLLLRRLSFYSYCVDVDLGEMLLNFPLNPDIRPYAGVDLRPVRGSIEALNDSSDGPKFIHSWECWGRFFMGLRPSPYLAVQYLYLAL